MGTRGDDVGAVIAGDVANGQAIDRAVSPPEAGGGERAAIALVDQHDARCAVVAENHVQLAPIPTGAQPKTRKTGYADMTDMNCVICPALLQAELA